MESDPERSGAHEQKAKVRLDRRLVYIMPSVIAICLSLTACVFLFRDYVVDLQNTRYCAYIEASQSNPLTDTDEECLELIDRVMTENKVDGFTVNKSLQGAFLDKSGNLVTQVSYEVILMKIPRDKAYAIIAELQRAFGTSVALVEESRTHAYYLTRDGLKDTAAEVVQ